MGKQIELNSFIETVFSQKERLLAIKLRNAREICENVVMTRMEDVDSHLDQKNDPMYIAYLFEYWVLVNEENTRV